MVHTEWSILIIIPRVRLILGISSMINVKLKS